MAQDNTQAAELLADQNKRGWLEMDATEQNFDIAEKIIAILETEKCTVRQSEEILRYVESEIRERSTVQSAKEKGKSQG